MAPIRVLYLGMYWDYGDRARGTSFEENSFHAGLKAHPNVEVTHFDYVELNRTLGREAMNAALLETVENGTFDCLFYVPFTGEVETDVLAKISARDDIVTIAWGCDDHWRFENFSCLLAPSVNWWVTTARSAVPKFKKMGYDNVIKSQWAVEPTVYYPVDVPLDIPVSFIGQPHGSRVEVMRWLYDRGIEVALWGFGWNGVSSRVTHEQMLEVFSRSAVSLNLSNASMMGEQQIKGRVFEVPGCRGLLLTDGADDMRRYYEIGKEIVVYKSLEDLAKKIRFYSTHTDERNEIATAGYERTMAEHTWKHRFDEIFAAAGLG
ncbi:MAG: glycosyltransferase [Coriobacteriia bacterium]|nr:glycosyltransferase [Coriobacteriia bacterium]